MATIGGRGVRVIDASLQTLRLETAVGLGPGADVRMTLYPLDGEGRIETAAGVEAVASVADQPDGTSRLTLKMSTYPLYKLIVRSLAQRQGIEPYHPKIGL